MKKILYTRLDGSLSIVIPVINTQPTREAITEAEAEQRAWSRLPEDAINPQFVEDSAIPQDRTFRNAWRQSGAVVRVDMGAARELHKEHLRRLRAPKFEPLERAQRTALVLGDAAKAAVLEGRLQALRDAPADPAIEAAQTPEELKSVLPEALK